MLHGGDLLSYEDSYKGELIDFSSNINPLGPPKGLYEKLIESFHTLNSYPDIQYRKLKASIGKYLNCNKDNVVVGNGAVEILNNFIFTGKRILVFTPSFSEYELRAIAHGKEVKRIPYKEDFTIDTSIIKEEIKKGDLLILGNPNNPTGLRIEKDVLLQVYEIIRKKEGYLLLDEAFYEFCPSDYDSIELFKDKDYENIGIIRAATKFFALPGIRLGYGCASRKKVEELKKIELPWTINSLADSAGQFIFKDKEYIKNSRAYIERERKYLLKELKKIPGIKVYDTQVNYILIKLIDWDEEYVFKFFLNRGIIIRKCKSFIDLSDNHIRVAIKDRSSNEKLINIFKNLFERRKR
ncbi:pyridoxal phosphate-dependent aminotransferase [Wansuia hejianensis]|uniref:Aminotransferase class I/II-fold pyridoxal phosphate-dependent enzyme n=1 Tax=Wansuia hejianensis TaxID=2763667 RepID=A0A926F124_9FIRM|nr:histidinol-phosphate transaminase [Wansuia hejianensis]MBC8591411.1 aminotransferase class I/II-fold pyridoxal phosphate-dependent enzyme [Wansuia hejianensis]